MCIPRCCNDLNTVSREPAQLGQVHCRRRFLMLRRHRSRTAMERVAEALRTPAFLGPVGLDAAHLIPSETSCGPRDAWLFGVGPPVLQCA